MNTTLVILAAGIGSRYKGGIKQLEGVGPRGEIIMDYSIHDAIRAGFNKIVFVIRREIEQDFHDTIGARIESVCGAYGVEVRYVFQDMADIPEGFSVPEDRAKPWGTGQALLACREVVREPFAVINADDYYGRDAFRRMHDFLQTPDPEDPGRCCLAGFVLGNTLSDHGSVTRGICRVSEDSLLTDIQETYNIRRKGSGAESDRGPVAMDALVSMNMWGMTPQFLQQLQDGFVRFFREHADDLATAEFLIPIFVEDLLSRGEISVQVLRVLDRWFGITYQEDLPAVREAFQKLNRDGIYQDQLFSDL